MKLSPDERRMADIWEVPYREFTSRRENDYRLRLLAPPALQAMRRAAEEHWSLEKLALHLDAAMEETRAHFERYQMSEKVHGDGAQGGAAERLQRAFDVALESCEPDEKARRRLSARLCALTANHLHLGEMDGEPLAAILLGLEKAEKAWMDSDAMGGGPAGGWGPQWKD